MSIEEIVAGLKEQGLDETGIKASLADMLENGEITLDEFHIAMAMLSSYAVFKNDKEN